MSQVQFNTQLTDQIKVSDEAVKQLLALTENEESVSGVRIFVSGGGCGGSVGGGVGGGGSVRQRTSRDGPLSRGEEEALLKGWTKGHVVMFPGSFAPPTRGHMYVRREDERGDERL